MIIHRGYSHTIQRLYVAKSIALSSAFTISGAIPEPYIERAVRLSAIPTDTNIPHQEAEIWFDDLPDRSVIDYCQEAYDKMGEIVETAERRFPV